MTNIEKLLKLAELAKEDRLTKTLQGERGATGETGQTGAKGETGTRGAIGPAGERGETGAQGVQGVQGIEGLRGERGIQGKTGAPGLDGTDGLDGRDGAVGPQGAKGPKGEKGEPGEGFNWLGPWRPQGYVARDVVEHDGSSWVATAFTERMPTLGSDDWDLMAAAGKNGANWSTNEEAAPGGEHGDQPGGTLHADATSLADGFMTVAHVAELTDATADIAALVVEVNEVESDVADVAADVAALQGDVSDLDAQLQALDTATSGTNTGDQVAGAGLTGTSTLAVGAHADGSIVVNANDVQVGVISDTQHGTRGGGTQHAVAGGGSAGFMTDAQVTKLAGIATGATAEVDAASGVAGRVNTNATEQVMGTGPKKFDSVGVSETVPAAPGAGSGVRLFARKRGRILPASIGADGQINPLQAAFGQKSIGFIQANGGGNASFVQVGLLMTVTGAFVARTWATTNILTQSRRVGTNSSAPAGNNASFRDTLLPWWRGNAANLGGFHFVIRFGLSTITATRRWFVGFTSSISAIANADPSALTSAIGVGQDVADTDVQFMHNDAAGTCTKSTGSLAIVSPTDAQLLEVQIYCPPNSSSVFMTFEKLGTGLITEYEATSNLPPNTTQLAWQLWLNNASTASAVGLDLSAVYIESEY